MQKTQKVTDTAACADAVLSHCLPQPTHDFTAGEFHALDQAHNHPHVGQDRRIRQARFVPQPPSSRSSAIVGTGPLAGSPGNVPDGSQAGCGSAVRRTWWPWRRALRRFFCVVPPPFGSRRCSAGRNAAGDGAAGSRTDSASSRRPALRGCVRKRIPQCRAANHATLKLGIGLQDRVQRGLILPDKRPGAIVLMPIGAKREKSLDGYGKKAKSSVILPIALHTSSSYLFDANASRGRARFFMRARTRICGDQPHKRSRHLPSADAVLFAESTRTSCASNPETTTWKEGSPILPSK